jgi:hypothetical protein
MTTQLQNLNTSLCAGKGQSVLRLATGSTVWATSVLLSFDTRFKHLYSTNAQRSDGVERRVAFLYLAGSLQSAIACTHIRAHSLTHSLTCNAGTRQFPCQAAWRFSRAITHLLQHTASRAAVQTSWTSACIAPLCWHPMGINQVQTVREGGGGALRAVARQGL